MVGYQGLSSRLRSQRQSEARLSSSQTGLPIAPAKCAIDVSTVTTKSRWEIRAALSSKSRHSGMKSTKPGGKGAGPRSF